MKNTLALLIVLGLVSCGKKEEVAQQTPAPEPAPAAAPAPPPPPARRHWPAWRCGTPGRHVR